MADSFEAVFLMGAGILIVVGVWLDFVATAMMASVTGVFSRRFSYGIHLFFRVGSRVFHSQRWNQASGPCIILALIVVWFGFSWVGWSLIYLGGEEAIVSSGTKLPAQAGETIYFVGMALTTLGTGDYVASGTLWDLISVVTAFNGLALVTLSITYAIPVIQAAAQKRALACQFALWGGNTESVLRHLESDQSYKSLTDYLKAASPQILLVAQNHLAYPILHYFHSPVAQASLPLQIAVLDEVLRELPDEAFTKQPELYVLVPNCSGAIAEYLITLSSAFIEPSREEPPCSNAMNLKGISYRLVEQYSAIALSKRRKLLRALIEANGWSWQRIIGDEQPGVGEGRG